MSLSEEPTTTKAQRVVIVGYNKASLFPSHHVTARLRSHFLSLLSIPLGASFGLDGKKVAVALPRQLVVCPFLADHQTRDCCL